MSRKFLRLVFFSVLAATFTGGASRAGELDPKAVEFTLPANIQWKENAAGTSASAVMYGDLAKPGPYAYFVKWKAGNMSRPHFHPNDRFIVVMSGTWWVGSGTRFEPDSTVPMPAGTYVVHHAQGIHYDGAKQGDAVLLIHGMGPATSTPAEQK
jgi:hypothetical protein